MVAFAVGLLLGVGLYTLWRRKDGRVWRALPSVAKICLPIALLLSATSIILTATSALLVLPMVALVVAGIDIAYLAAVALRGASVR